MTNKSKLLIGVAVAALSGAAATTAFADDYNAGRGLRYDDQAEQTRDLNREALEQAREQNDTNAQRTDDGDDDDDDAALAPVDNRDSTDDDDDDDDDDAGPGRDKDSSAPN
jgi:hypothetical protein